MNSLPNQPTFRGIIYSLEDVLHEIRSNKVVEIILHNHQYQHLVAASMVQLQSIPTSLETPTSLLPTMDDGYIVSAHEVECLEVIVHLLYQALRHMHLQLNLYNDQGHVIYHWWNLQGNNIILWIPTTE